MNDPYYIGLDAVDLLTDAERSSQENHHLRAEVTSTGGAW